ncbi:MAG: GGDEF domain-containing protein [Lachnospiraceae bacterium]|nr:GGDEF domain-containing protein [Lachnospiraceae bacterium]
MRQIKFFYIAALAFSVVILCFYHIFYFQSIYSNTSGTVPYVLNVHSHYMDEPSSLLISGTLPENIITSDVLHLYTSHCNVWVYVDNTLIYKNTAERFSISKTPGNIEHFIDLEPYMARKPFSVVYQNCYYKKNLKSPPISIGSYNNVTYNLIVNKLPAFIVCTLMFTIGCIALICCYTFRKQLSASIHSLFWLALFAIAFSAWSGFETQLIVLLIPYHLVFSWYTILSLKLVPIPAIMFISYTYHAEHLFLCKFLVFLSGLDIIITSILQYLGIFDFKQTLPVTHGILALSTLWIFGLSISKLLKQAKNLKNKEQYTIKLKNIKLLHAKHFHVIFILVLAITVILDFISYYLMLSSDSARFSRLALLAYIIALAIKIVQDSLDLQKTKEKADNLEKIAATDPLTKLKNRASFKQDIQNIPVLERQSYGIAMFDLNRLKYFNDVYGHSAGDYYIIICSEIIQDIFSPYGTVYRIGGDEFCAILKDVSIESYKKIASMITIRIQNLCQVIPEYHMEVADGYAIFNARLDKSILHTVERADQEMYQKKQVMKAASAGLSDG